MFNIKVSKSDSVLKVDWDSMPENAKTHIIEYGLRQKLNDAGSQFKKDSDNFAALALGAAENVLDALMKGNVHVRQAAASMTLEEREFRKILKALLKKAGLDPEADISVLATKLGKDADIVTRAIEAKASSNAEVTRKVQALKAGSVEIEI